ncbi:MAG: glycosyltransferase family 39 protein [Patescibacteria group bacterium]|nr:glycosyltransferase family 39 protein [Patescibacteria group bacterium]
MKLHFILLSLLIAIFLFLNVPHLLDLFPVWPDESSLGDVALGIIRNGKPTTELWGNLISSVSHEVFWYPPVFLYLLSFWFKFFGFSIVNQRLLSIVLGCVFLDVFFIFSKLLINKEAPKISEIKSAFLAFLGSFLLIIDPTFSKSAIVSRPEMLIMILVVGAAALVLKMLDLKNIHSKLFLVVGGLLVGMAPMVHFLAGVFVLALVFFLALSERNFFNKKSFWIFVASAALPSLLWLLTILPNLSVLSSQLNLEAQGRNMTPGWLNMSFTSLPLVYRLSFLIYFIITLTFFVLSALTKRAHWLLISLMLGAAWMYAFFGKIEWYSVYITPFAYAALILLLVYSIGSKKKLLMHDLRVSAISISAVLLILGINNYLSVVSNSADKSYTNFAEKVRSIVPAGKIVFLSSIPDLYYAFRSDGDYKLYEFPQVKTNQDDFKGLLDYLDYVVINAPLSNAFIGSMLDNYLQENVINVIKVDDGGYKVLIYELKHK